MFDYKLLHALNVVIAQQSFEKAAVELCLTQSAVSQRIKLLEQTLGQPVLIRSQPIEPTPLGMKLLAHYQQVSQLEQAIMPQINAQGASENIQVNLASNADSLATWLISAIGEISHDYNLSVNFLIADENRTLNFVKKGEAFAAISTVEKALSGCSVDKLGDMTYILVASKPFQRRYFSNGIDSDSLKHAPAVAFDQKDDMHINYIEQHFGLKGGGYPCHTVRSSEAFVAFATQGLAYCLIPQLQIQTELAQGKLINLLPDKTLTRTLYWHRWSLLRGAFKALSQVVLKQGQAALNDTCVNNQQ
ncbi:LysR family transcriptional regulator, chromosome initiation inhibitor [Pseudoalteromonas ulvae UL12]|uniref:Transcriptional regulator ArgP n=1 Tax=Pseudoalteromonas ulvae TaxID=107327 RepID=A0A244CPW8_PSEDV|nr:LysR family transcriptional regulator ArgP [Pseudoalteromonas ulvae]MBE0364458.1 LysR family transcriptional regulator, chromosome initiation inhibitor [Pseudoalteromonas ulvae UL12]OUL57249.1 transcriptional regulator ArgP [Pseudoalteromonas ulvae]